MRTSCPLYSTHLNNIKIIYVEKMVVIKKLAILHSSFVNINSRSSLPTKMEYQPIPTAHQSIRIYVHCETRSPHSSIGRHMPLASRCSPVLHGSHRVVMISGLAAGVAGLFTCSIGGRMAFVPTILTNTTAIIIFQRKPKTRMLHVG